MICELCNQRILISDASDNAAVLHLLMHLLEKMNELEKRWMIHAL